VHAVHCRQYVPRSVPRIYQSVVRSRMSTLLRVTSEVSLPLNMESSVKRSYQSQSRWRRVGQTYAVLANNNCYSYDICLLWLETLSAVNANITHYTPSRTLRSSDSKLLFVPRVRTCFGSRSFAVATPTIWNSLPLAILSSVSTHSFRRQLKTFFYNLAFRPS